MNIKFILKVVIKLSSIIKRKVIVNWKKGQSNFSTIQKVSDLFHAKARKIYSYISKQSYLKVINL